MHADGENAEYPHLLECAMSVTAPAPVALFAYNRPVHFARVTQALSANPEAIATPLYVFSDAPKRDADRNGVAEVRARAHALRGFKSIEIIEQRDNQGVARSIIDGIARLTAEFGRVIVLEDDLLPSANFLAYTNGGLALYEDVEHVASIAGFFFPGSAPLPDTFFIRGADCWGWATWARAWAEFEPSAQKLLNELRFRGLEHEFDFQGSYPYTQMLEDQISGKNDSWAIRWYASAFLRNRLTLYPRSSQIQNIGADGSGVHVGKSDAYHHDLWGTAVSLEPVPIQELAAGRQAFARGLRGTNMSLGRRVMSRLARLTSHSKRAK